MLELPVFFFFSNHFYISRTVFLIISLYLPHIDFTFSAGMLHIAIHQTNTMGHGQNLRKLFYEGMKPIMASYGFNKGGFHREGFYKAGKGGKYNEIIKKTVRDI